MSTVPTICRMVMYRLRPEEVRAVNKHRDDARTAMGDPKRPADGAQVHVGNHVNPGDEYPMMIARVWGSEPDSYVNGQVFLDGNDVLWVTSVKVGEGPGTFSWPVRA